MINGRARRQADGTDHEADQDAATLGFAIEIKDETELGLAILIAVYAASGYRPVGVAVSISEAREIAERQWRHYTGAAIEKYELWRRVWKATTPGWRAGGQAYRPCLSGGESRTG